MEVTITFRTPARTNPASPPAVHERILADVPSSLAAEMAKDFVQSQSEGEQLEPCKLYRYERDGDEMLVALDFAEVIALTAQQDSTTPTGPSTSTT